MSLTKRLKYEYLNQCGTNGGDSKGFYEYGRAYRATNPDEVVEALDKFYLKALAAEWSTSLGKEGGPQFDMMLNGEPMPQEVVIRVYDHEGKMSRIRKLTAYATVSDFRADYMESQGHANDAVASAEEKRQQYQLLLARCGGDEQMLLRDLTDEFQSAA